MGKFQMPLVLLLTIFFTGCSNAPKREIPENLVYEAILADDSRALTSFFNSEFSPAHQDKNGISLLDLAIKYDSLESLQVLARQDLNLNEGLFRVRSFQALEILIKNGADPNVKNSSGDSLVIHYIKNKPDSFVQYIISQGASLETEDSYGWKPIFWAASVGSPGVLKELLNRGANPQEKDREGNLPIYYVTDKEKLELLLEYGYDLNTKNIEGENIFGEILMKAVANREFEIIEKLLNKGVNPGYRSYGRGAMDIAERAKDLEMIEFLNKKVPR
ncbi:MAG: ankyrin repeat domain-containing protein [Fusobacteriaceae bacterium]